MLPDLSARGATLGVLLGIGPQRRPEQTTVSLGAGAFAAEAANASVPQQRNTVLGFHGRIERAFDLWSHTAATIGFHPLVLVNLRGSTHVIASFLVGLRIF